MKLNSAQQQAVTHSNGPLLIVAGAGTGKTTVITQRIKYLVESRKVDPYQIFATTFTEKAAAEMEKRLDKVMPFGYQAPWIGTFHGICERILRLEGLEIGLNPNFTIMTETDQWIFFKQHLFAFKLDYYLPLGNPSKFISAILTFFSRLADEDITSDQFKLLVSNRTLTGKSDIDVPETHRLQELVTAYTTYQQLKRQEKKVDFGDLIGLTLKLFRLRPNILDRYKTQFQHLLIDEFQDTNIAQFELIQLLAPPSEKPNLIVVGDDNQSIYKFRGASISNILQFMDLYPQAKTVVLTNNYRSTKLILAASYKSIQLNNPDTLEFKLNISKQLTAEISHKAKPQVFTFNSGIDEAIWTVKEIIRLVTHEKLSYKDIAILTRSNSQLDPYIAALKTAGIPYQRFSNNGLFDQPEVSHLLDFLKVIYNPKDSMQLFKVGGESHWNLNQVSLLDKIQSASQQGITLWELLKINPEFKTLISTINHFRELATKSSIIDLLRTYIEEVKYLNEWVENDSIENQLKINNLNLFFNQLKHFEQSSKDLSLVNFLSTLDDWIEAGENPGQAQIEDIDTVSLMTIHGSKGLEYKAVFIGSLLAGRFPSNDRKDKIQLPDEFAKENLPSDNAHINEERRLFYVALTRAKHYLYLTYSPDMGGLKKWKPSGFIAETGLEEIKIPSEDLFVSVASTPPTPVYLKQGKFVIEKVSYTQLDTFSACPLRYKFKYLLHIPIKESYAASYGNVVHQTLQAFEQQRLLGTTMSLKSFTDLFTDNFETANFTDPNIKQERFSRGLKAIKKYYLQKDSLLGVPQKLETEFKINLATGSLIGKIDRIDKLADHSYAILDYKTSEVKSQSDVDKDEQLSIYALVVRELFKFPVSLLGLYFFDHATLVTTTRTDKQLNYLKTKLDKRLNDMQHSDFPAKPDPHKCSWCEFNTLCPFASKKKLV